MMPRMDNLRSLPRAAPVDWLVTDGPVDYEAAVAAMQARAEAIAVGRASELVWLLEHPPLYTAGTSARIEDLLLPERFPVYRTGRGGQYTYHGPGQRIVYVMLDVGRRTGDVRAFVSALEGWTIGTLAAFGVPAGTHTGQVGVWVARPDKGAGRRDKIAAIGLRLRRWISQHGLSINVDPDLAHFDGIVPCGVRDHGVTSLADLGCAARFYEVDRVLRERFEVMFGETRSVSDILPAVAVSHGRAAAVAGGARGLPLTRP
jgi:lipoyl(octanoyl) transferase